MRRNRLERRFFFAWLSHRRGPKKLDLFMDLTADATAITYLVFTLWLASLTYIWSRHVREDEKKQNDLLEVIASQDKRIERAINRIDRGLADMHQYQTEFNLTTATTLAQIKEALNHHSLVQK